MRHDRFEGDDALVEIRAHPMTTLLLVMFAGSIGVGLRYILDAVITSRAGDGFPWSTLAVNIAGAFALGLVVGILAGQPVGSLLRVSVGIGLLGGFTTFSAFALEAVTLVEDGELTQAAIYIAATNALGIGATFAGLGGGRVISG